MPRIIPKPSPVGAASPCCGWRCLIEQLLDMHSRIRAAADGRLRCCCDYPVLCGDRAEYGLSFCTTAPAAAPRRTFRHRKRRRVERVQDDPRVSYERSLRRPSRYLHSTDASIFESRPLGVVLPRDEEDLQALVRYAGEHLLPLAPRVMASPGKPLDPESSSISASTSARSSTSAPTRRPARRRTTRTDAAATQVGASFPARSIAPGMHAWWHVADQCVRAPAPSNTATHAITSNGCASCWIAATLRRPGGMCWSAAETPHGRPKTSCHRSSRRLCRRTPTCSTATSSRTPYNRCGYLLHDVLRGDSLNLARLLVGSEGTLAFFTEATRTIPLPGGRRRPARLESCRRCPARSSLRRRAVRQRVSCSTAGCRHRAQVAIRTVPLCAVGHRGRVAGRV